MHKLRTLVLEKKDIEKLIDIKKAIVSVEKAFKEYGLKKTQMPPKIYLNLKKYSGDFRAMPAYLDGLKACALKWVNVHPNNKAIGLPTVMAVIILSDPQNGFPLAIMDGTYLTSLRTAAAGGVAAKYLANKNAHSVALVGCGAQAITQLKALRTLFKIKQVNVWGHKMILAERFLQKMKIKGEDMKVCLSVKECVDRADIIATTTPSRRPLVKYKWIKKGAHINAIGADAKGKQELETQILKKAKVVIDDWEQASHSGEINVPLRKKGITKKNIYAQIGDIVCGKRRGRTKKDEITVFDSTGLAIQDVAVAHLIYTSAVRKGRGKKVQFV